MPLRLSAAAVLLTVAVLAGLVFERPRVAADRDAVSQFRDKIQPLLKNRCGKCHSATSAKAELNLSTLESIARGSESGPVIDTGSPEKSRLIEVILDGEMPPEDAPQLTETEKSQLVQWITSGAAALEVKHRATKRVDLAQVLPVLQLRCTVCHGTRKKEAGLDLRTRASLLKGGKSGPAIVPGKPEESLLLKRIHAKEMPPKRQLVEVSIKPIEPQEVDLITRWVAQGAKNQDLNEQFPEDDVDPLVSDQDRAWWSFRPPERPLPSLRRDSEQSASPIDGFLLARLASRKLKFAPRADKTALIRRLYFDLLGLPPTPADVQEFVDDDRPDAWSQLVDRVLASPHYGEQWGGYWLDLAGYSDSEGISHSDPVRPHAWRYRDYVIRAFNDDKPYDVMLTEQLAGDELVNWQGKKTVSDEDYDRLVATGFLRMPEDGTFAGITGFVPDRLEIIDDTLEVFSSSVLGLTVRCARCHSHKFDPIPQRDYYRLAAIFKGALDENDWLVPKQGDNFKVEADYIRLLPIMSESERAELEDHNRRVDQEVIDARREFEKDSAGLEGEALKKATEEHDRNLKQIEAKRRAEPLVRALWDRGEPSPTYVLRRGNYLTPGRPVDPGVPSALLSDSGRLEIPEPHEGAPGTGRRLALARWLTQMDHPLTARVMVNRIWRHHFEHGIVETLDDFGRAGAQPSHRHLLDWLALDFIDRDWSIKSMHRLILNSAVYQQRSAVSDRSQPFDSDGRLLSRMPLKRVNAEALRDSILFLAGKLNNAPYGSPDPVYVRSDGLVTSEPINGFWRRSIYVRKRRSEQISILASFDRPKMSPNCIDRPTSTVAPQALHLMNNAMVHQLSEALAHRVASKAGSDRDARIRLLFDLVANREPDDDELATAAEAHDALVQRWSEKEKRETASQRALTNLSHGLLNSAAFLYID